jgi:Ribbon-helix-helix protein, copG family
MSVHRTRVTASLDANDVEQVARLADEQQCSQAAVIRRLVRAALRQEASHDAPVSVS